MLRSLMYVAVGTVIAMALIAAPAYAAAGPYEPNDSHLQATPVFRRLGMHPGEPIRRQNAGALPSGLPRWQTTNQGVPS